MSEDSFIKKIILRLSARQRKSPPQPAEQVDPALVRLFQMLERTREDEIPCEEVFELLDHYVETLRALGMRRAFAAAAGVFGSGRRTPSCSRR